MVTSRVGWSCLFVAVMACGHPAASPLQNAAAPAKTPALTLEDGAVCPPGPRSALDACLAEHAFCARDVTPLDHALPDLVVVITHGAIDCAGYYLLAASGGQWSALQEVHRYGHHDPRYGSLAVTGARDEHAGGHRVTHIAYTIEVVPSYDEESGDPPPEEQPPEQHELVCTWPAAGVPSCQ
jgi:hypothetical protein